MLARLSAFVVWALVAGAIVFWGLRLFVSPTPAPNHAVSVADTAVAGGDLSRLFGVEAVPVADAPPPESTRFRLLGVLAPRAAGAQGTPGVALVSVDGKPPRAYRAGARIEDRVYVREVTLRAASFGPEAGPVAFTLEVPRLPDAATGSLAPPDPTQLQMEPPAAAAPPPPPPPVQPDPGNAAPDMSPQGTPIPSGRRPGLAGQD